MARANRSIWFYHRRFDFRIDRRRNLGCLFMGCLKLAGINGFIYCNHSFGLNNDQR